MAEKQDPTLKKLSEQLTCPICLEVYKEPKVLDCHHVFCSKCLEKLVTRPRNHDQDGSLSLSCPTCREPTTVPDLSNLRSAFHIHSLFDIQDTLLEQRQQAEIPRGASAEQISDSSGEQDHCLIHQDRVLELYCETCKVPICCKCIVDSHTTHSFSLIAEVVQLQKEAVSIHSALLEQQLQLVDSIREKADLEVQHIKQKQRTLEKKLEHRFELFHKILEVRHKDLVQDLAVLVQEKLNLVSNKVSAVESVQADAKQQLDATTEGTLSSKGVADMIALNKQLVQSIGNCAETTKLLNAPPTQLDTSFCFSQVDIDSLSTIGELFTQLPCAVNSTLQVEKKPTSFNLGDTFSAMFDVKDQYGECMEADLADIKVELYPTGLAANLSEVVPANITKFSNKRYKVSYMPSCRGRHQLNVTINGEQVTGSPHQLFVVPRPAEYHTPVHCMKGLSAPWGVACDSKEEIIISENKRHCLTFISQEAKGIQKTIGRNILRDGFHQPTAVCVHEDYIYVVEQQTCAITKCTSNGKLVQSVGSPGNSKMRFMSPMGIAVSPCDGKLYVADTENNRIQILNSDMTFHSILTSSADENHKICLPSDIAFDRNGAMYFTDNEAHCIHVYSGEFNYLRTIGRKGKKPGKLGVPFGIFIDDKDLIYVTEVLNDRVSVFETSGKFLHCFGSHGNEPGQFDKPHKIAMDTAGYLYVTDTGNNRLQVF